MGNAEEEVPAVQVEAGDTTVLLQVPDLGKESVNVTCPDCGQNVNSSVKYEPNMRTHMIGAGLFLLGGLLCCWIPYCNTSYQTAVHTCPVCRYALGTHEPR